MAVTVTQVIGGVRTHSTVPSTPSGTKKHVVHVIDSTNHTVDCLDKKTWIAKVKAVGTVFDWVKVDLWDLQGELLIAGLALDESDEITGPFGKVKFSSIQDIDSAPQTTTEPVQALVWEFQNG